MKKIALILILFIGFSAFSQEKELNALEILLEKANPKTEVYYNKSDKMLDINGFQIPLRVVEYRYLDRNGATLKIRTSTGYPLYDGNKDTEIPELEIRFANKADVYKAINLMDDIRGY